MVEILRIFFRLIQIFSDFQSIQISLQENIPLSEIVSGDYHLNGYFP